MIVVVVMCFLTLSVCNHALHLIHHLHACAIFKNYHKSTATYTMSVIPMTARMHMNTYWYMHEYYGQNFNQSQTVQSPSYVWSIIVAVRVEHETQPPAPQKECTWGLASCNHCSKETCLLHQILLMKISTQEDRWNIHSEVQCILQGFILEILHLI